MADVFRSTAALCDALADATFARPPALVSNAHITGLGVARALTRADVPVIALDRNGQGVAPPSNAVDYAGAVTYPLNDKAGFREDVQRVVEAAGTEAVAFPCMDEWVHAYVQTEPDGVVCPFADQAGIDRVLDKTSLYRRYKATASGLDPEGEADNKQIYYQSIAMSGMECYPDLRQSGQVTIPEEVRKGLDLKAGDQLKLTVEKLD